MPRGRKKTVNLSYEQRIEEIEGKIEAHKNAISDLKKELKRLTAEKELAVLENMCAIVMASGKSPDESLAVLKGEA